MSKLFDLSWWSLVKKIFISILYLITFFFVFIHFSVATSLFPQDTIFDRICSELESSTIEGPVPSSLAVLSEDQLPSFTDDLPITSLREAISFSLSYLQKIPASRTFSIGSDAYTASHLKLSLEKFDTFLKTKPTSEACAQFIIENYRVYGVISDVVKTPVLFTGYYEPLLPGSLIPTEEYCVPILPPPADLIKKENKVGRIENGRFMPYYTRAEIIERTQNINPNQVLVWTKDQKDLFFLQIQGSGRVRLTDGNTLFLRYASTNGRAYRSIGRYLIDEGKIPKEEMSMQRLKQYLNEHPDEEDRILNHNPSYVFFHKANGGPYGALGVQLTPGRSIALDRSMYPLGTLAFMQCVAPIESDRGLVWAKFSRFALPQDTGGAIKGLNRVDIFYGHGSYAEIAAGYTQHRGNLFILVLKPEKTAMP